ncbi:MAG: DUF3108 domain-containing protein, partial [Bacteroidota bacterium]
PPSLPLFEEARYDIRYGILGAIGALRFSARGLVTAPDGSRVVHIQGSGEGAVLGFGGMQGRIESEFDPGTRAPRRWSALRLREGQKDAEGTMDTAARGKGGTLLLERLKPGQPLARQSVAFTIPTSDPLSLLWRLRMAPPALGQTETLQLLDGQALWRVSVTTSDVGTAPPEGATAAIRLDGELAPIFYDGRGDSDRPTRRFTLWLSTDVNHLPLRLEVPIGLADVVMTLAEARRLPSTAQTADQPIDPVPGARNL